MWVWRTNLGCEGGRLEDGFGCPRRLGGNGLTRVETWRRRCLASSALRSLKRMRVYRLRNGLDGMLVGTGCLSQGAAFRRHTLQENSLKLDGTSLKETVDSTRTNNLSALIWLYECWHHVALVCSEKEGSSISSRRFIVGGEDNKSTGSVSENKRFSKMCKGITSGNGVGQVWWFFLLDYNVFFSEACQLFDLLLKSPHKICDKYSRSWICIGGD
jgi:hypothetical protein